MTLPTLIALALVFVGAGCTSTCAESRTYFSAYQDNGKNWDTQVPLGTDFDEAMKVVVEKGYYGIHPVNVCLKWE